MLLEMGEVRWLDPYWLDPCVQDPYSPYWMQILATWETYVISAQAEIQVTSHLGYSNNYVSKLDGSLDNRTRSFLQNARFPPRYSHHLPGVMWKDLKAHARYRYGKTNWETVDAYRMRLPGINRPIYASTR